MDTVEVSALEYADYGGLLAFLDMLHKAPPFPENRDRCAIDAWSQVYETILAALEDFPVCPVNEAARAQFIAYVNLSRSFMMAKLGGQRGDPDTLLGEMAMQASELPRALDSMKARLGIGARSA